MMNMQKFKIKEICSVKRGGSPRPIDNYLVSSDAMGRNWLLIGDIEKDADYITKTSAKIKEDGTSKTILVYPGELILSNSMSFGRPYIMQVESCIHDGWLALKNIATDKINVKYFYYLLRSNAIQREFNRLSAGSGVRNLKREVVENIVIRVPKVNIQQKIVQILDDWNESVLTVSKIQENNEILLKYLYGVLLSGYKQIDVNSDDFAIKKLGDIANIDHGQILTANNAVKGDIPVIAGGVDSPYTHNNFTHENVITVSASGANAGYVAYRPGKIWASDCNVIYGRKGISDTMYVFSWLILLQRRIYRLQTGGAQPHVHAKDLAQLEVLLPSLQTQKNIMAVLSTQAKKISELKEYKENLKKQYSYLLNHLISGDYDLTNIKLEKERSNDD